MDLDLSDLAQLLRLDYAVTGPDGLVLGGSFNTLAGAVLASIEHAPEFSPPDGSVLRGAWSSGYSCSTGWHASFELPRIHITDPVVNRNRDLSGKDITEPVPGPDGKSLRLPVAVFSTSYVVPSKHWKIEDPPTVVDQYVSVAGDAWSYVGPFGGTLVSQPAHIVLHTSAGLVRYRIGHVPEPPAPPSQTQLVLLRGNCEMLVRRVEDVHWLVDPPEFDYGHEPLRQWQLHLDGLRGGQPVTVESVHPDGRVQQIAVVDGGARASAGPVVVDVVTDRDTSLRVGHGSDGGQAVRAQVIQQWLLPTTSADLGGAAVGLIVRGDSVEAIHHRTVLSRSAGMLADGPPAAPPATVALPDGRVAAVYRGRLVLAVPFGGAAVRERHLPDRSTED